MGLEAEKKTVSPTPTCVQNVFFRRFSAMRKICDLRMWINPPHSLVLSLSSLNMLFHVWVCEKSFSRDALHHRYLASEKKSSCGSFFLRLSALSFHPPSKFRCFTVYWFFISLVYRFNYFTLIASLEFRSSRNLLIFLIDFLSARQILFFIVRDSSSHDSLERFSLLK